MKCGLLGKKLGHSYSPQIHSYLGTYSYVLYEKSPQELPDFLKNGDFTGLNVTIPYKKTVIPYCSELSPRARALGAVNTLVRKPDGTLIGHNTDFFGFETILRQSGLSVYGKKALVLGSGGASATAVAVLEEQGAEVVVISRSGKNNYENLHLHPDTAVIINATPVGMYPKPGISPLDLKQFPKLEGVLDMIYNPAHTRLLLDAADRGLVTQNGLLMLVAQAKESAEWFTGCAIADSVIATIYRRLKQQMGNIILIGMPGSGKSTVGAILAKMTGKLLVDADTVIAQKAGKSIPEIFAHDGEPAFRALESQVLAELGMQSGLILATGGGCVTRKENWPLLHQNGIVFCLDRALDQLPKDGRPLSQATNAEKMYKIRKPLYNHFSDYHVDNNGTPEDSAKAILKLWEENV